MTEIEINDLLAIAKRNYPVETIFWSALKSFDKDYNSSTCVSRDTDYSYARIISGYTDIIINKSGGWIYCSGKWADIIKLPKNKQLEYAIY